MTKSISLAKAREQIDVIDRSFNADTNEKKKLDSSGMQSFTLACSSKALKIIKNENTLKDRVAALKECYEENKIDNYINL